MKIIKDTITIAELQEMSKTMFGNLVKAVVDIRQEIMMVDASLHVDQETALLAQGSQQEDLWGINFYPFSDINNPGFVEFDSMINLRPAQNNNSRSVEDPTIQNLIITLIKKMII